MDSTQVLINSLSSANSVEELRNRLIPLLTRVADAAPSEGITSITSDSLDVTTPSVGVRNIEGVGGDFTSSVVITTETNCAAECVRALFSRVNNIVTCTYYLNIELAATFTTGGFNVSTPVATVFATARDAFGVITPITDPYSKLVSAITGADTATNEIGFTIVLDTAGETLTFVANIQYIILP